MADGVISPGRGTVGKFGIILLLIMFSTFALLEVAALVWIWPALASAAGAGSAATACPEGSLWLISWCPSGDQRLLCIVFLAGMLGGVIHALRSLGWYVGNRHLVRSWIPWYLLLPLLGGLVSVVFFLVIRGGFFTPQTSQGGTAGSTATGSLPNVFGFAAFSAMIGLFTNQALLKLQQTFESLLATREQGKDPIATTLVVKSIQPNQGPNGTQVQIAGSGFGSATRVKFGAVPASQVTLVSGSQLTAVAPPQGPGTVDLELVNPDNQNAVLHQAFTYVG
ncbi:MAG TPA: IPT/TIG domain-containing protein [Thermoanaerobaculia bacterium]|jgi:hypothetical protein|nr:IPT/TIG domain-containing protein [Thermoanaerobaculia bacterium]